MKKFLIIFGSFILFLVTTGTLFKLLHWPGAGPLLVLGMSFFSFFFLPLFFIDRMILNKSGMNIVTNIFALLSSFMIFTGVLFKVMHWPGAGPMLVFGSLLFIIPTLVLYVIQQFKEYDRKFSEFWRVVTMGILVSAFFMLWGLNVSRNILTSFLKTEDATLETNAKLHDLNKRLLVAINENDSSRALSAIAENVHKQCEETDKFVNDIKRELTQYTGALPPEMADEHWNIGGLDNYDIPTHLMCGPNGKGRELFERLNRLKMELTGQMKKLPVDEKEQMLKDLGDLGIKTDLRPELMEEFDTWEDAMFYHQVVAGTLSNLSSIQNEIKNAEFECLMTIYYNL